MALEMREKCERCGRELGLGDHAFVCSYECTFCPACARGMAARCPNCGGELLERPRRRVATVTPRAVVRRLHDVWNSGDLGAVDEVYAEDFVGHFPQGVRRGRDGARSGVARIRTAFPDWHESVEQMVAEGNTVVTRYTSTGTHRGDLGDLAPTGRAITMPEISIYRIARDKVAEQWCVYDQLGRLQQLGAR